MTTQILDRKTIAIPGATGDVTPEAMAALSQARDAATDAGREADRSEEARDRAEIFAAGAQELQDSAVATLTLSDDSDTSGALRRRELRGVSLGAERLTAVISRPARPTGTLWPQALEYVDSLDSYLIGYNGVVAGQVVFRVDVVDRETGSLTASKQIDVAAGSTEGMPHWLSQNGDLMLFIRTDGENRYAIWNFTQNSLSAQFPISGRYKAAQQGGVLYTCDASTATGGLGKFYLYDFESVKAGAPQQIGELILERRNMFEKVQAFSVGGHGEIIANFGKSTGDSQMFIYDRDGRKTYGVEYDREALAGVINAAFPGTVNANNYRHEAEGMTLRGDTIVTSHIVDNNSPATARVVLIEHFRGVSVPVTPITHEHVSRQIDVPLVDERFQWLNSSAPGKAQRVGDRINIWGELSLADANGVAGGVNFARLPSGFLVDDSLGRTAILGTGPGNTGTCEYRFYSSGVIRISRYSRAPVSGDYFYFYASLPARD